MARYAERLLDFIISALAQYGFILSFVVAGLVWLRLPRRDKLGLLLIGVAGGLPCLALTKLGGDLYYDPRPFVSHHVVPLFAHGADNSFPSDHTALTMLVGLSVFLFSRRWGAVLVALSLAMGAACVAAHAHSPIDIVGAVAIAAVATAGGYAAARWALSRWAASRPHATAS